MNDEAARSYVERMNQRDLGAWVNVKVPLAVGSHHTIVVFSRESGGEYSESYSGKHPSGVRGLDLDLRIGDIIYQRVTSPASAQTLERYGAVLRDHHVDWGSDADWVVDFGPMGDVTRRGLRSPSSSIKAQRGRVLTPQGEEAVGGAVPGVGGTSGGGSG